MKICVFDTETTGLEKPYCYNIGWVIYDTEEQKVLFTADYVVEQIWHNMELFNTAYYADKRPLYVKAMRARKTKMEKFGNICQAMLRCFKFYGVEGAYAYNSPFDVKVFQFNCDWFKCINPFDDIPVFDIRGYAHKLVKENWKEFTAFCEEEGRFTDSGNYSSTAETLYTFISGEREFKEEHTALADSLIETEILWYCLDRGAQINMEYEVQKSLPRKVLKELVLIDSAGDRYSFCYESIRINKDKTKITLK